jgi:hypothetical protein
LKIPFISNLKKPACAPKPDVLELPTLWYVQYTYFFLNDLFLYIAIDTVFHPSGIIQNDRRKLLSELLSKPHGQSSNYIMKLFVDFFANEVIVYLILQNLWKGVC